MVRTGYDQKGYTKEHFEMWNTAQDFALIKSMGFDHVRLSVNPQPMFRHKQADRIPADYLEYLDTAVKMILDHGLAVIIDIYPDSDFKEKLAADNDFVEQFEDYWRQLARHYSDVRTTLEKYGIGWTMWDYSGGFDVVAKKDGRTMADEVTLKALGLRMPAASR